MIDPENNDRIYFLEIISDFRKNTCSGLGTDFFSFCSLQFKINCIKILISRGYKGSMHSDFDFWKHFFVLNGYLLWLVDYQIKYILHNIQVSSPVNASLNNV